MGDRGALPGWSTHKPLEDRAHLKLISHHSETIALGGQMILIAVFFAVLAYLTSQRFRLHLIFKLAKNIQPIFNIKV